MSDLICPNCGGDDVDIEGAVSHGDGDLSDACFCHDCGETFDINTRWFGVDGIEYASQEEMWSAEASADLDED